MKNFLIMFIFLPMSGSFIAIDYESLPTEIKERMVFNVVQDVLQNNDLNLVIDKIKQLRLVNNDFRDLVDSDIFTKYIIDALSQKEFPKVPEAETSPHKKIVAALLLGTPAALNYIKPHLNNFLKKQSDEFQHVSEKRFQRNIAFYKQFAKALVNGVLRLKNSPSQSVANLKTPQFESVVTLTHPLFKTYAEHAFIVSDFEFVGWLIDNGYDYSPRYHYYFYFVPITFGCKKYQPMIEFMLNKGVQFHPEILAQYKQEMPRFKEKALPYCKAIYELLVSAKKNQNSNIPIQRMSFD